MHKPVVDIFEESGASRKSHWGRLGVLRAVRDTQWMQRPVVNSVEETGASRTQVNIPVVLPAWGLWSANRVEAGGRKC